MQELLSHISIDSAHMHEFYLTWGISALLLLLMTGLHYSRIKEYLDERFMLRSLRSLGRESLHGVLLPDGIEGEIYLEHLILTPVSILAVRVKRYQGVIFAAENIEYWTQVTGNNKSYKFENPLRQLENDLQVIRMHAGDVKVECKALFMKGSQFPKGKPDNVISFAELSTLKREFKAEEIPPALYTAWKRLVEMAKKDTVNYNSGVLIENQNNRSSRLLPTLLLGVGLLFWLVWRLAV